MYGSRTLMNAFRCFPNNEKISVSYVNLIQQTNETIKRSSSQELSWTASGESRCSHRPQALLVCHSDGGTGLRPSERLLSCSVSALRSPPRWSPCRCRLTAGLYAWVRRWWLTHNTTKRKSVYMFFCQQCSWIVYIQGSIPGRDGWLHSLLSSSSKS